MAPRFSTPSSCRLLRQQEGSALVIALMSTLLLTGLGLALVMTTSTETMIANNYRSGQEGLYAAEAGLDRAMQDLLTVPDWNSALRGQTLSAFVDGAVGVKSLPDGKTLDLTQATNMLNCAKLTTCSAADMDAITAERPWGTNNPRWQLYAYGPIEQLLPTATIKSPFYVVVWVSDDPAETDGDPLTDGGDSVSDGDDDGGGGDDHEGDDDDHGGGGGDDEGDDDHGSGCGGDDDGDDDHGSGGGSGCGSGGGSTTSSGGVIVLHAEAFGPGGAHKIIEATISRTDVTLLERGYSGQRGEDEMNRRYRNTEVQTPGAGLTQSEMSVFTGGLSTR